MPLLLERFLLRDRTPRALSAVGSVVLALATATCDASTAFAPPEVRNIVLAWEGDTLLHAGSTHVATVAVTVDGEPYPAARVRLSSSDVDLLAVDGDGRTLRPRRLGVVVLTAELVDATLPRNSARLLTTLVITPSAVRLSVVPDTLRSLGDTVRLTAVATDASGQGLPDASAQWSASDTSIARVSASGVVTAVGNGVTAIEAKVGGLAVSAPLVVQQRLAALQLSPVAVLLDAIGASVPVAATAVDARGAPLGSLAPAVAWTNTAPATASLSDGRLTAIAPGATWLRVVAGPIQDSIRVDVVQRAARVVIETPSPVALRSIGETSTPRVRAYDRRDNEILTATPAWRSLDPLTVHVESATGIATGLAEGSAALIAELHGVADTLLVEVANVPARVLLEPELATLTSVADSLQVRWSVRNARGVEIPGATIALRSSDSVIVRTHPDGQVVAMSPGAARVIASTSGGVADTTLITVVNAVAHVDIVPDLVTLASVGDSTALAASIRNARSTELPRTAAAWTSDDGGVARVTASGIVIATGAGETHVRATSPYSPDRRDSVAVVVTNAVASVMIEKDSDVVPAVGTSRAYGVEIRNARGALLATSAAWRSLDPAIAAVTSTGLVTTSARGTARIVASAGSVADTLVLTVRDDLVSLDISPGSVTLTSLGDRIVPTVTGRNAFGDVVQNPALAWSSSDTVVAKLQADGSVLGAAVGTARIVVASGTLADTLLLTVRNEPVSIDVAAVADTIPAIGDSLRLAAAALNARGDTLSSTSLTWSVDDPVVARVSSTGTVTARDVGATWVRATGGTARDSAWIVVTNEPAAIVATLAATGALAALDTMTAPGQSLDYDVTVRNRIGLPIPDAVVTWTTSDAAVAAVTASGATTAMGYGGVWIVARAGTVADSIRVVVTDPRRIYVNNAVVTPARFGTLARPFATIQAGVDAAGVDDSVFVFRGTGYSEAVTLGRRITLLGDSADFVAGARDPLLLPLLRHDLDAAGIASATPGGSYTLRYLGIQHSVDGEAIAIRDADNLVLSDVYVNPVPAFRTGRGILVERATGSVNISRTRVDSVYGFGIRLHDVTDGRLTTVTVRSVGARTGYAGAAIDVRGGAVAITGATVRRTAGPQVLIARTVGASLQGSTLTGEQQLVRLDSVRGTTTVRGNTFDLRLQAGESSPVRVSGVPDPSGIEVLASAGVLLDANVFTDVGGQTSLMDGVRLADTRVGSSGAAYGARLTGNRFRGGRVAVRSSRSAWSMTGSRVDSASVGVLLADADTAVLTQDTVMNARAAAVRSTGAAASLVLTANFVSGIQRAVTVTNASQAIVRNNVVVGGTGGALQADSGAIDLDAAMAEVVGNSVTGVRSWAGLVLRGGSARVDSNYFSRNAVGLRLGAASVPTLLGNSIVDNDTLPSASGRAARGLVNAGPARALGDNWWGAPEGPPTLLATSARGDSLIGNATTGVRTTPIAAHQGAGEASGLRRITSDRTAMPGDTVSLAVRAIDAGGRPLAGATTTFSVASASGTLVGGTSRGNTIEVALVSDGSGLATARFVPTAAGTAAIAAAIGNKASVTFHVTVP